MLEKWDHEEFVKRSNTKPRDIHKDTVEALKCNDCARLGIKKRKYQIAVQIWISTLSCETNLIRKSQKSQINRRKK